MAAPLHLHEADKDTERRFTRALVAADRVLDSADRIDTDTLLRLDAQLEVLRTTILSVVVSGPGSVTDFQRFTQSALVASVDRIIAETSLRLSQIASENINQAFDLGDEAASEPLRASQLNVGVDFPAVDSTLITASFENMADLLSEPMQRYRNQVVSGIRRVAVAGENRFTAIDDLRQVIDSVEDGPLGNTQFIAERIIRTEVSRAFSGAQFERMRQLARQFPFLRKGWQTSRDSRVRAGHVEAGQTYKRGQGIPIEEKFALPVFDGKGTTQIGTVLLLYPVDPAAEPSNLAARATIMCRCNLFSDFDLDQFEEFTADQVQFALGPDATETRVGITSFRTPGQFEENPQGTTTPQATLEAMAEFEAEMLEIDGITNLSVTRAEGAWRDSDTQTIGSEPSWRVRYIGNGEARRLIASTGLRYNQDGTLVYEIVKRSLRNGIMVDLEFQSGLSRPERAMVGNLAAEAGLGGWTWFDRLGNSTLRLVSVPQWGGTVEGHRKSVRSVVSRLRRRGFDVIQTTNNVKVDLFEHPDRVDSGTSYTEIIEGD